MTTFKGSFSSSSGGISASGTITLNLNVDAAAGSYTATGWDHVTGTGSVSNYVLSASGKAGFPHAGNSTASNLADSTYEGADINDAWYIAGDAIRFDGNIQATTTPSINGNGLNLAGTAITGTVNISPNGLTGTVTTTVTLTGPAVPTLYNLAQMNSYVEKEPGAVIPTAWSSPAIYTDALVGYEADVFSNADDSQIVIDVRGTQNLMNWYANLSFSSIPDPNQAFRDYIADTSQLLAATVKANPNTEITLSGHSLGGAIVQLVGNASHYSTVAFDAPGAMQLDYALQAELAPATALGSTNSNPGSNVDIRVVGDGVSLVDEDDTIDLMTLNTTSHPNPDDVTEIKANHAMSVVVAALQTPGTTLDFGATEPDAGVQLFGALAPAVLELIRTEFGEELAVVDLSLAVTNELQRWIDPSASSQIIFQESNGSPAVTAIDFLADPNIATYEVWSEVGGTWSAPQTVTAGTTASFSPGVHAFKIEALSASGQVVTLPDGFLFGATFASTGQVNANVASINLGDFNGTNIQTPVAGQTTLTIDSSFNYTDAGNGTLTVNGTASGNDTILLGSGNKTVNLGSGNDFVMVKDGATGNIVIHGGSGAETVLANAANVTLVAGTGDILFTGGDDTTGGGSNTIDYSAASAGVSVNLATGVVATPNNAITTLVNVENINGSRFADHLTGDAKANILDGGGGGDILTGGGGNDIFVFDAAALTDAKAASPVFDEVTDYSSGDQIDLSALLSTAFNHGSGQAVGSLVRAVEDASGTFALLQVDTDGSANGTSWTSIAKLDGMATGGSLNVILDSMLPAGSSLSVAPPGTIEALGATSLAQSGNNYFLYANGASSGLELKYGGTPWVAGQWGAWTPYGAEATATGYEVAFKIAGSNQYTVWNTDANGNIAANPIGTVTGNSLTLEALETSFHQDLNGDGAIGLPASDTLIELFGSTSLVQIGSNFVFDKAGGGPELHYDGTAFVAGQWGGWTPIGVEATASGYEVAFKIAGADQYTVWDTDANGNILIDPIGTVTGESPTFVGLERSFQQDLNGDGKIGNPSIPIPVESFGSTSLVQTGNDYFLYANGTSSGPALKYGGAAWTDGEWGGWTPIGAEATATGYEVAFNLAGTSQYTVWNTDANGNITSDTIGTVSSSSSALVALETGFHQDLNGDGIIGDPSIPFAIETSGATSLTQLGHDFFLYAHGTSSGPELKYGGAPWAIGQWGGWTPIGAEATATGYEVAFKLAGSDVYTIWNADTNGNITTNPISSVSGSNSSLQAIETSFHQDLNGDGVIGPASHTSMATTAATATTAAAPITAPGSGNAILAGSAAADTFVFNAHFGNDTVAGFQPGVDQIDIAHTLFAGISDLFSHTADNTGGSAVVTIAADQSITFDHVSKLLLQQHASDFHLM